MKQTAVAKAASHAKHPKATKKKGTKARTSGKSSKTTRKHTGTSKHAEHVAHLKHEEHVAHEKARGLSLGEDVACCSAEALAASLRLAGARVSDDDVLELHWRAGGGEDEGVSIWATLETAAQWGLAGYRPVRFQLSAPEVGTKALGSNEPCILGLELPGPHAVLAEPGRWWSWGERYDPASFPHARIEEAWAVSWS